MVALLLPLVSGSFAIGQLSIRATTIQNYSLLIGKENMDRAESDRQTPVSMAREQTKLKQITRSTHLESLFVNG